MGDRQPEAKAAASARDALAGRSWSLRGERRWAEVRWDHEGLRWGQEEVPLLQIIPHSLLNPGRSVA